jgi:hypothetical protein
MKPKSPLSGADSSSTAEAMLISFTADFEMMVSSPATINICRWGRVIVMMINSSLERVENKK